MKRSEIIARRRAFAIPGYKTLADVGFDGEWVTPYQMISKSKKGPVLVATNWLDWRSVYKNHDELKERGYLPSMDFNVVMDLALERAGRTREEIYLSQAFHLLPQQRRQNIPCRHVYESFDKITRHEAEGRTVIALGLVALDACLYFGVDAIKCIHPSANKKRYPIEWKAKELSNALLLAMAQIES
ncbi:MAG: hypothetical protein J4F39_15750 [Candidatus Latescibacteria bacterium]|nr:hypothetical protein [Candidatus Latescibacterota bacterium]